MISRKSMVHAPYSSASHSTSYQIKLEYLPIHINSQDLISWQWHGDKSEMGSNSDMDSKSDMNSNSDMESDSNSDMDSNSHTGGDSDVDSNSDM